MPDYTKEQLWKLYEKLPGELKEAIFSVETADNIYDICARFGIEDNRVSEVAKFTGRVLLGILAPEDFQKILEEEVKLEPEVSQKIAQEINRFIFYPVKENLVLLYEKKDIQPGPFEIAPSEMIKKKEGSEILKEKIKTFKEEVKPKRADVYREPIK